MKQPHLTTVAQPWPKTCPICGHSFNGPTCGHCGRTGAGTSIVRNTRQRAGTQCCRRERTAGDRLESVLEWYYYPGTWSHIPL